MIKQAALLVASVSFLVYFIAPVADDPEQQPIQSKKVQNAKPLNKSDEDADSWEDEDDDDGDDTDFVFGEPMVDTEPVSDDDDGTAKGDSNQKTVSAKSGRANRGFVQRKAPVIHKTPKAAELGSRQNPIDLSPKGSRAELY